MEHIINKIKDIRKTKGYSHEYMAHLLHMSQAAYTKIEKGETKLTLERLFAIAEILETPINDILEIKQSETYNQENKDNATGYLQKIENYYQDNKEKTEKIELLYEARLKDKDILIAQLQKIIEGMQKG
jgi:transcriptional regulator with XRE-family HTH domain